MKKKLTASEKRAAKTAQTKTAAPKPHSGKKSAFKTIATIVILLAAGASAFYFGLVKVDLTPDQVAVFYSKTGGFSEKLIRPGDFVWKWEKLLPTNTRILVFTLSPYRLEINREAELPSADVYSSYLDNQADFSFKLKMSVNYQVRAERLPSLCSGDALRPEGTEQFYKDLSALISESVVSFIQEYGRSYSGIKTISMNFSKLSDDLKNDLEEKYTSIEIKNIVPDTISFPDLALYQSVRESYLALMEVRKEVMAQSIRTMKAGEMKSETRLDILSRYGEVFKKYPELLQFFNISPDLAAEWLPRLPEEPAPDLSDKGN